MKQKLLALAAVIAAAGAGTLTLVNWDTGATVASFPPGGFEILNKADCTVAVCNAPLCNSADNVLSDAGSSCTTRLVTCSVRLGAQARAWAADAGLPALGASHYQRIRFVGLRCAVDGGSAFGVPLDDIGLPQFSSAAQVTPLCVRAPLDGGMDCERIGAEIDGGNRFIGTANVMPAAASAGAQCEPVECNVFYGDNPLTDL